MENILKEILGKLDNLQGELTEFKQQSNERFDKTDSYLNGIDSRLDEHYQLLRALEHATEVHKADTDNLIHQVAHLSRETPGLKN